MAVRDADVRFRWARGVVMSETGRFYDRVVLLDAARTALRGYSEGAPITHGELASAAETMRALAEGAEPALRRLGGLSARREVPPVRILSRMDWVDLKRAQLEGEHHDGARWRTSVGQQRALHRVRVRSDQAGRELGLASVDVTFGFDAPELPGGLFVVAESLRASTDLRRPRALRRLAATAGSMRVFYQGVEWLDTNAAAAYPRDRFARFAHDAVIAGHASFLAHTHLGETVEEAVRAARAAAEPRRGVDETVHGTDFGAAARLVAGLSFFDGATRLLGGSAEAGLPIVNRVLARGPETWPTFRELRDADVRGWASRTDSSPGGVDGVHGERRS